MGKDSNTLSMLVVSAHLADQSVLDESQAHAKKLGMTLDRALVMLGHISQFHMSSVLDAEQMVKAGALPMETAIKALRMAKEQQRPFKQVLSTLDPELLRTQTLPKVSHPVLTLLIAAQILTKEAGTEALHTRLKTGVQIGQILLLERKVSSTALRAAIAGAALIKEGKVSKQSVVKALEIVNARGISLEQALFELDTYRDQPGDVIRIGELVLMAGVITERNLLECMEISVVDDRDINNVFVEQGILGRPMIEAAIVLQDKIGDGTITAFLAAHALKQVFAREISIYEAMAELPQAPSEVPSIVDLLVASGVVAKKGTGELAESSADPIKVAKYLLSNKLAGDEIVFAGIRCHCLLKEGYLAKENAIAVLKKCNEEQIGLNEALSSFQLHLPHRKQWAWKPKKAQEEEAPPAAQVQQPSPSPLVQPASPAAKAAPAPAPLAEQMQEAPPSDLNSTQQRLKAISQLKTTQHASRVVKPAAKTKDLSNDAHANEVLKRSPLLRQYLKFPIALWLPLIIFAGISLGDLYATKFRHAIVAPLAKIGQEYVLEDYSRSLQFDTYGNASLQGSGNQATVPYETLRPGWSECLGLIDSYAPGRVWLTVRGPSLLLTDGNYAYSGNSDERTMRSAMIAFAKALDANLSKKERFVKTLADLGKEDLSYTLSDNIKLEPEMVRQNLKEDSGLSAESLTNALCQMDAKTLKDCAIAGNQVKVEIKPNALVGVNFKGVAKVNRLSVILAADRDGNLLRRKSSAQNFILYTNGLGVQEPGSKPMSRELSAECQKIMVSSLSKTQALRLYGLIALGVALYIVFQRAARYTLIHDLEEQTGIRGRHGLIKRWIMDRRPGFAKFTMFVYCLYVAAVIVLYFLR